MINLAFLKSKFFLCVVVFLIFIGFTYRVYDIGYYNAVYKLSAEAIEAKGVHDTEIKQIEDTFAKLEREYLEDKAQYKKYFDLKYKSAIRQVNSYVKDNGFTDCSIGTNGVQRVNDLLKGTTSENK